MKELGWTGKRSEIIIRQEIAHQTLAQFALGAKCSYRYRGFEEEESKMLVGRKDINIDLRHLLSCVQ